jgi:hypothetical protein
MNMNKYFHMLGMRAEDRVTGFNGVVTSICFDLYGCIQVLVNPGMGKDSKLMESHWFDTNRIRLLGEEPVMSQPTFTEDRGPAEKPRITKA